MFTLGQNDESTRELQEKFSALNPDLGTLLEDLQISRMELKRALAMQDPDEEIVERLRNYLTNMEVEKQVKSRGISA